MPVFRPPEQRVFSVYEFVTACSRVLEGTLGHVWVEGEISNLRIPASGHAYFTLVGEAPRDTAAVDVVLWRSTVARLRVPLADGRRVRVYGRPGIYDKMGRFQLYGERVRDAGEGDRLEALAALRRRLEADGLLDPSRKRPLPRLPRCLGVVTSSTGAALRDIVAVVRARRPMPILVAHATVQGEGAPASLRAALERLARAPDVDVVILGRGGGSMEDLWAFNDEALARAVAACPVPVISAVGHEVDVTATDWVADVRAATPTHAAELATEGAMAFEARLAWAAEHLAAATRRQALDRQTLLRELRLRLAHRAQRLGEIERRRLAALAQRLERAQPLRRLTAHRTRLLELQGRLHRPAAIHTQAARARLRRTEGALRTAAACLTDTPRRRLAAFEAALRALDPTAVLARGYAIALDPRTGRAVLDADTLAPGDALSLRFARGAATARVERVAAEVTGTAPKRG